MAFVWVQDISPGAPANAAGLNEIQDNLDTIYAALGITRGGCASGAGWTEFPIAGGLVTDKLSAQAQELRSVTDYAYDNKCPAHDVSVQTGYENADKVGVDGTHYPGYDSTDYPGYYYDQHGSYESGYFPGIDIGYHDGYFNDQHTSYQTDYLMGVVW
ncbi:hypothetical protein ES708_03585 [subsurface metagenome]